MTDRCILSVEVTQIDDSHLTGHRGTELGRDGLDQHLLDLRVKVDDLTVTSPVTAPAARKATTLCERVTCQLSTEHQT